MYPYYFNCACPEINENSTPLRIHARTESEVSRAIISGHTAAFSRENLITVKNQTTLEEWSRWDQAVKNAEEFILGNNSRVPGKNGSVPVIRDDNYTLVNTTKLLQRRYGGTESRPPREVGPSDRAQLAALLEPLNKVMDDMLMIRARVDKYRQTDAVARVLNLLAFTIEETAAKIYRDAARLTAE